MNVSCVRFLPGFYIYLAIACLATSSATSVSFAQEIGFERIQLSDAFYSEGGTYGDYNRDGHGDVAVGPWIYLGPDFSNKSQFYPGDALDPAGYSENFLMYTSDVNADGWADILVLGFPGKESWWYENPAEKNHDGLWKQHVILDSVDNESPVITDIDGDGVDDLVCSSRGHYGYATHAGQSPESMWRFVKISPNNGYQRFTHGLGVGDVNNDGHRDLLEKDGWWQNPGGASPTDQDADNFWSFHAFEFSTGGSQMHTVDFDGDGRNEVLTGLVAHGFGLVYYKALNEEATRFERVDIMTDSVETSPVGLAVSQLHAVEVGDIDNDGVLDIVTGKRWWAHANKDAGNSQPATLLWLETRRSRDRVLFVPHVIDNSSGVGTQVTLGDVNGDGLLDIVSGIKRGAYLFLQRPSGLPADQPLLPNQYAADAFDQNPASAVLPLKAPATQDSAVASQSAAFVPAIGNRPLNFNFQTGNLDDWEIRGPMAAAALIKTSTPAGDNYSIDTGSDNPKAIGELISRPFKLLHPKLEFQLAGKQDPEARVEVVAEASGRVLGSALADSSELHRQSITLSEHHGEMVRIRVVDHTNDGYLQVDDFQLSD